MKIITTIKPAFFASIGMLAIIFALNSSLRADAVSDWNAIAVQAVVTAGSARPGPAGALDVAMVHAAVYDAVQAIEGKYDPYYVEVPGATGSSSAATAKAAHDILVSRFPAQTAALDLTYSNYLIAHGISPTDPGISVGETVAARIIALRSCDGSFPNPAPPPFIGGTGIGVWRPTPTAFSPMNPGPWLGQVTPYFLTKPFQFRSDPPPAVTSREYARDYNEVKALGSLTGSSRTPEQTDMAFFWAGNFVAMMNRVVRDLAGAHVDNIADSSRLFALTSMSNADTSINVWNDKAYYVYWRPITAIHNGDIDGNPRTAGDANWASLIATPPYPDYTSGANGLSGSTMAALEHFFGTSKMDFSVTTTNTGPTTQDTRNFTQFSDAADEVVEARILLGIHFRFADVASRRMGAKIARYGFKNYLRPVRGDDDDDSSLVAVRALKSKR